MSEYKLNYEDEKKIFGPLGFKACTVGGNKVHELAGVYYRLDYINREYGYAIETAESKEEAQLNRFEDSAVVPLQESKEKMIEEIVKYLKEYFI